MRLVSVALVVSAAPGVACSRVTSLPAARPGAALVAKGLVMSDGTSLNVACTPTGPEQCFNARDDNCNGVIDEGCGTGTGVLQFMVAWADSPADVDLVVTEPGGAKVQASSREAASGLQLEKNCPDDGCHGQNVENVFFEGNEPPRGKYVVEVKLVDARGADLPVLARLSARVGNRTFSAELRLVPGSSSGKQGFTFTL